MVAILTVAFAFGSAVYAFTNKYLLVVVVLGFYVIIQKLFYRHRRQKFLSQTLVYQGGQVFCLRTLLDSGNALTDPTTQAPISLISLAVFLQMFPEVTAEQILWQELDCRVAGHYIDCQTVTGSDKVFVFQPDKMQVNGTTIRNGWLGVTAQNFGNSKYDALLNIKLGGLL